MSNTVKHLIAMGALFCITQAKSQIISPGQWRGEIKRDDGNHIVFNMDAEQQRGKEVFFLRNAEERLLVDEITVENDTVVITLPFFDAQFRLVRTTPDLLNGFYVKKLADRDLVMPVELKNHQPERFPVQHPNTNHNITGRWAMQLTEPNGTLSKAVAVLQQKGTKLTGSVLTPYGDYRYLQGVVDGDSIKFSGFDGGYALLFTAKMEDGKIIGKQYTGSGPQPKMWQAVKDENASLPEEITATKVRDGVEPRFNFTFPDVDGNPLSINDDRFKNKVIIIQILGTWCPNCLDETIFMNELYDEYKAAGLEIIGLAYERTANFERSQAAVKRFMERLKVQYPVAITPIAVGAEDALEKTLPQLERIPAYPTTIFIDRKGEIQTIHAGFNGPGTGNDYILQKEQYTNIVKRLLAVE